jgi:signal transduction histidine kinase
LYDLGLKEALGWLAEDLEKRHGIKIEVRDDGADKPLDDAAKAVVFRAVRELLMNVLKHAKSAAAKVSLRRAEGHYLIDVEDQGIGFDLGSTKEPPDRQGFGLLSVREQISRLGGDVTLESCLGSGTVASVRVPLQPSAAAVTGQP